MANDISSQITSTVLNQTRATETAQQSVVSTAQVANNRQTASVGTAKNRQDNAVDAESAVVAGAKTSPDEKAQLEQAVSDINDYVQTVNRELKFRVDEALPLGRAVVTVIDADTDETIREFPSEEALALARSIREQTNDVSQTQVEGLIISAQA